MRIVEQLKAPELIRGNIGITIGNFEGYHLGHREIVEGLKSRSLKSGIYTGVITFSNHPLEVINGNSPERLWARCDKIKQFCKSGIDILFYIRFTPEIASMTPGDFLDLINREISPSIICIGESFRFGFKNMGDVELMKKYSETTGWDIISVPDFKVDNKKVSSSVIREEVKGGNFKIVNKFLGRRYRIYIERKNYKFGLFVPGMAVPEEGKFVGEIVDLDKIEYYNSSIEFRGGVIEDILIPRELESVKFFAFEFIE